MQHKETGCWSKIKIKSCKFYMLTKKARKLVFFNYLYFLCPRVFFSLMYIFEDPELKIIYLMSTHCLKKKVRASFFFFWTCSPFSFKVNVICNWYIQSHTTVKKKVFWVLCINIYRKNWRFIACRIKKKSAIVCVLICQVKKKKKRKVWPF